MNSPKFASAVAIAVAVACAALSTQAFPFRAAGCGDLRDSSHQLACTKKAYRAWLSAGQRGSKLRDTCYEDLVQLPKSCNMTTYFEEALEVSEHKVDKHELAALKDFVDGHFADVYLYTHTNETPLHVGYRVEGPNCCLSDDGPTGPEGIKVQSYLNAQLASVAEKISRDGLDEKGQETVQKMVGNLLYGLYLRPCHEYYETMSQLLFGQLGPAVESFMGDNWSFLDQQTREFRNAVFRYQWCARFVLDKAS